LIDREGLGSPEQQKRHLWIVVMGVPASGKSTLAEVVAERLGFIHVPEFKVEDDDLFTRYYENPQKYSFPMQSLFLFNKWQQTQGSKTAGILGIRKLLEEVPIISQPPIWQDALYARARLGRSPEFSYYKGFYEGLVSANSFPTPDLVVYMRISFENMLARIEKRARENEARAPELIEKRTYWKKLWKFHEVWVRRNLGNMRIAVINGDLFNFSRFKEEEQAKESLLQEFLHQVRYHLVGPLGKESDPPEDLIIPEVILNHRPANIFHDITPGLATKQRLLQRT